MLGILGSGCLWHQVKVGRLELKNYFDDAVFLSPRLIFQSWRGRFPVPKHNKSRQRKESEIFTSANLS